MATCIGIAFAYGNGDAGNDFDHASGKVSPKFIFRIRSFSRSLSHTGRCLLRTTQSLPQRHVASPS